jgi:hypothetical protein
VGFLTAFYMVLFPGDQSISVALPSSRQISVTSLYIEAFLLHSYGWYSLWKPGYIPPSSNGVLPPVAETPQHPVYLTVFKCSAASIIPDPLESCSVPDPVICILTLRVRIWILLIFLRLLANTRRPKGDNMRTETA